MHSVLFLILAFFNAAGLFVLLGAEFLAMILVVVYVGAVAVLFLFVVMMLDVDFAELRQGFLNYLPIGGAHRLHLCCSSWCWCVGVWAIGPAGRAHRADPEPRHGDQHRGARRRCSTPATSTIFQIAGVVLLVAMIGAIVLTCATSPNVRRQNIADQVARTTATAIEIRQVRPGQGI